MRRKRLVPAATLAMVIAAGGCEVLGGSAESRQGGGDLEKTVVRVADLKIIDSAPVRLAVERGHFTAEGLTVELTTGGKGSVNVDNVLGGSVDIGLTSYPPAIAAVARGKHELKIVTDAITTTEDLFLLVVAKDGPVRTVKDLIGKKIAVSSKGGIGELALRSQMAVNDVTVTNEQYVSMQFADMPSALERGDVQAAIMNEPFLTQTLQAKGVTKLLSPFSGSTADFPTSGWVARKDFAEKNPKTVAAFQRAMAKAVQDAQDRGTVEAAVVKYVGVPPNVASLMTMPVFSSSTDVRRFQRVVDLMKETGELPSETQLDMRTMVLSPQ